MTRIDTTWTAPLALLLATGGLLGISTNLAKLAGEAGLNPLAFLAWSVVGATIVLVGLGTMRQQLPPLNAQTIEYFLVSGLVSVAAPNLLFFAAVPRVGAAFVSLSIAFPPLFTYLGALMIRMERFQTRRATGVAFALGGAIWLAVLKLSEPDVDAVWVAATLTAPVIIAVGNIYRTARWPVGATPNELAPGMLAASGGILLAVGTIMGRVLGNPGELSLAVPTARTAPVFLILAQAVTFSIMYLLYFGLQKRGGPVYLSLLGSVGAVVGVPIAVLLLGEIPPQGLAIGGTLIALGVGLLTLGNPRGN